jgi:hypothetical protein
VYDLSCTHLMCHLLRVPSEAMMSLMSNALGTHEHVSEAEGHRVCGGSRALPHRKAGLDPLYMWQYRSPIGRWSWGLRHVVTWDPSCAGDESGAARHVATPEPSPSGWRARCHGARDDARTLWHHEWVWSCRDTRRHRDPPLPVAESDAVGAWN